MPARHAGGAGSIPAFRSEFWGRSIAANASPCRGEDHGFESRRPRVVIGYWLLVVGCWLLVIGCWLNALANNQQRITNNQFGR
jgi:hypothetical protein